MESGRCPGSNESKKDKNLPAEPQQNCLSIMYTNAQSIVNKINELRTLAYDLKPDIILINESWTNKSITKAYLHVQGYELYTQG